MNQYEEKFIKDMSFPMFANDETGKLNKREIKEIAGNIDIMVNNFSIRHNEIAEALISDSMARTSAFILALEWIRFWANQPSYMFDGRNEYSGAICRKLYESDNFQELLDAYCSGSIVAEAFGFMISEHLCRMHRTLMQTFSRTLFTFLDMCDTDDAEKLVNKVEAEDDRWYATPLI